MRPVWPPTSQVVLCSDRQRLDALPRPARESILALAAAFLPYYCNREVGHGHLWVDTLVVGHIAQ